MSQVENNVAEKLLSINAVKVQPKNPFTWASGWKSPIYCDNRKTLSYPGIRTLIKTELARIVSTLYPDAEVIAGVATGAIAQGALVAEVLGKPFVYVRSSPKVASSPITLQDAPRALPSKILCLTTKNSSTKKSSPQTG